MKVPERKKCLQKIYGGHLNSSSSDILLNGWIKVVAKCLDQEDKADTLISLESGLNFLAEGTWHYGGGV